MSDCTGDAAVSIIAAAGRIVAKYTLGVKQGMNKRYVNVSGIANGLYILKLNAGDIAS